MINIRTWFRDIVKDTVSSDSTVKASHPNHHSPQSYPVAKLEAGTAAPNFTLPSTIHEQIELQDLRGQPVILAFYPADWSPVCGDQMTLYNEILPEFERLNAQLFGISVDGRWSHRAFAEDRNLRFPLLSDFEPKGEVARRYGVYNDDNGTCKRALFVIDAKGIIRWSYVSPPSVNPGANGILEALEALPETHPVND